jgi:wingless-type MMTV integration site family protein 7
VAYGVTQACSLGNLAGCGCDKSKTSIGDARSVNSVTSEVGDGRPKAVSGSAGKGHSTASVFVWGGCSADVSYGLRFARVLLDAREIDDDSLSLMNLHNNRAGRKVKDETVKLQFKSTFELNCLHAGFDLSIAS